MLSAPTVKLQGSYVFDPISQFHQCKTKHLTLTPSDMFYENDLRSAVDEAVRESKLVACFVTGRRYFI